MSVNSVSPLLEIGNRSLPASPIKSMIFDFGGVLAKPDKEQITAYLVNFFKITPDDIQALPFQRIHLIRVTDDEFHGWEQYAKERGTPLPEGWRKTYQQEKKDAVKEIPGMGEILREIRQKGYTLEMLSNFEPWMRDILERLRYPETFDHIYLSCDTKWEKPAPEAYELVLNDRELKAGQALFIDDQLQNIEAAQRLGIDAIHFSSAEHLRKELCKRNIL